MIHKIGRRKFLQVAELGLITTAIIGEQARCAGPRAKESAFYVGTYTRNKDEGIYLCGFNKDSGAIEIKDVCAGVKNSSFLAIDSRQRFLYAVNETSRFEGKPSGAVSAFEIDNKTGVLEFVNQQSSHGTSPCYLIVDKNDRHVLVANYSTGNAAVLPIRKDGGLGEATEIVQHQGSSVNAGRQAGPHAHSIVLDAANRFAFVADLGIDKVKIYSFDAEQGKLTPASESSAQVKPGAGPRHIAFHPDGDRAYVINELDSTLTAFMYDSETGGLKQTQTISTLPADFEGENTCADVHVGGSGLFLYGSNRGHDSIVVFAIDRSTGDLSLVQHESTRGKTPRNFAIDPTGRFLLAANQNSDSIVVFAIDQKTGRLTSTGESVTLPRPVCVRFAR